jgi:hypothetical protein
MVGPRSTKEHCCGAPAGSGTAGGSTASPDGGAGVVAARGWARRRHAAFDDIKPHALELWADVGDQRLG